jgi:alkylhydroperoxidase/carboxymuconolactone decarboxylase family protein YurZ
VNVETFTPKSTSRVESTELRLCSLIFIQPSEKEREDGLSMKQNHLIVFAIACSNNNTESAAKILQRLHQCGATRAEITDAMMIAAWTGGIQHFTAVILK